MFLFPSEIRRARLRSFPYTQFSIPTLRVSVQEVDRVQLSELCLTGALCLTKPVSWCFPPLFSVFQAIVHFPFLCGDRGWVHSLWLFPSDNRMSLAAVLPSLDPHASRRLLVYLAALTSVSPRANTQQLSVPSATSFHSSPASPASSVSASTFACSLSAASSATASSPLLTAPLPAPALGESIVWVGGRVLLHGVAGVGKSHTVLALAAAAHVRVVHVTLPGVNIHVKNIQCRRRSSSLLLFF